MKKLVSQFVDTYMGEPSITSLTEKEADDAVAYFHDLLFEDYWPEPADAQPCTYSISPKLLVDGTLTSAACLFVDIYKSKTQAEPEPLDGDETERLGKLFLALIDEYQGNT